MKKFTDPSSFSRDHQNNLFTKGERHIRKALEFRQSESFDNRKLFYHILVDQITDLIVEYPDLSLENFLNIINLLINKLEDPEIEEPDDYHIKIETTLLIKFPDNKEYTVSLWNMNFYHEKFFQEGIYSRDLRIRSFIDTIPATLLEIKADVNNYSVDTINLFSAIILDISKRFYFLTDDDLLILLKWLHARYISMEAIFSNIENERLNIYTIKLETQSVSVNLITTPL